MGYGIRPGGLLGTPGTRVRNTQSDKSQYSTYVIQAIVFAIAGDAFILLIALFLLAIGWPALFVSAALAAFAMSNKAAKMIVSACVFFWQCAPTVNVINRLRWGIITSTVGASLLFASGWWEWLIARDEMLLLMLETITPLFLPLWIYLSLIGLWFFATLKRRGIVTATAIIGCLLAWIVSQVIYTVDFAIIWSRARYLLAVMSVPPAASGIVLCFAMLKEMIAPNLNFILEVIPWEQYKQAGGLLGLIFPRYIEWKESRPQAKTLLVSRVETMDGRHSVEIPSEITNVDGFLELCRAVHSQQKNFSVAEARKHGVDEMEMDRTIRAWAQDDRFIYQNSVGNGKVPKPTHAGRAMIKQYAQTPLLAAG